MKLGATGDRCAYEGYAHRVTGEAFKHDLGMLGVKPPAFSSL